MKIPSDVQKVVRALPKEKREKVEAIVKRHLDACRKVGVEPEYMDRVWMEAIETVEIEEKFPEFDDRGEWPKYESERRYSVYDSPRGNF
jgi:hypothetical protein